MKKVINFKAIPIFIMFLCVQLSAQEKINQFDLQGNRVGYGKGYYDRFLSKCKEDVIKVGLSFLSPIDCIEDVDFFDKKLDFCITPERVYAF